MGEHNGDLMVSLQYYPNPWKSAGTEYTQHVVAAASTLFCSATDPCDTSSAPTESSVDKSQPKTLNSSEYPGLRGTVDRARPQIRRAPSSQSIQLVKSSAGVSRVSAMINGIRSVSFVLDSGASEVSIPVDLYDELAAAGTVRSADVIGAGEYVLANGTTEKKPIIRIHSIKVGDFVLSDVAASVGRRSSPPLLGQSFLGRFRSWRVDNNRGSLLLVK
jgi:clan AA aspartic protease (TIGR02281 family)